MGGDIMLESAPEKGSVFSFEIGLAHVPGSVRTRAPVVTPAVVATRSDILARSLKLQLRALGVPKIVIVSSAAEARAALADHPGAALLCDIYIASEDATALARGAERSLVLLSPLARGSLDDLKKSGFQRYLIKPIRQSSLYEQLLAAKDGPSPARKSEPPPAAPAPERSFRVLLAEDNRINAVLATAIITRAGHSVDVAKNGEEAVTAARGGGFDIVLMDMHMPGVDGLEATRRIRSLDGAAARTPIIALTANAMASDRRKCVAAGMDDFISKPFEPGELTDMLEKWGGSKSNFSRAS
jgi:CheY-like chemotaxis protein